MSGGSSAGGADVPDGRGKDSGHKGGDGDDKGGKRGQKRKQSGDTSDSDTGGGHFDAETGALTREFKNYKRVGKAGVDRGYGKTATLSGHPFLRPQIMLIVAPTGAGKTTLALNIMEEILDNIDEHKLGKVMFYTGSPQDELLRVLNSEDVDIYGPEQTQALITDLRNLRLDTVLGGTPESGRKKLNILVLDDAGNNKDLSPSNAKGSDIGDVLVSHRHIPLAVILLVQKFNLLPTFARANASQVFLFPGKSTKEMSEIFQTLPFPRDRLENVMKLIGSRKHEFLWIDLLNMTAKRGFNQVILE